MSRALVRDRVGDTYWRRGLRARDRELSRRNRDPRF